MAAQAEVALSQAFWRRAFATLTGEISAQEQAPRLTRVFRRPSQQALRIFGITDPRSML